MGQRLFDELTTDTLSLQVWIDIQAVKQLVTGTGLKLRQIDFGNLGIPPDAAILDIDENGMTTYQGVAEVGLRAVTGEFRRQLLGRVRRTKSIRVGSGGHVGEGRDFRLLYGSDHRARVTYDAFSVAGFS